MELRHLRYFVTLAETLHFGQAAQRLHISQPPLSQQIKALEDEIGVSLLERTRRKVELTEAGRAFLPAAKRILEDTERAVRQAQRAAQGEVGEIHIGFTGSLPFTEVMPNIIYRFRRTYPDVQLTLREQPSNQQIEQLQDGRLDIGFLRGDRNLGPASGVALFRLLSEPLVVALNESHPMAGSSRIAMADLRNEPFINYASYLGVGLPTQVIALCHAAGFTPNIVQEAEEMPTVLGLVAAGLGISLVTASMAQIRIPHVRYIPLEAQGAHSDIFLAYAKQGLSPKIRNFLRLAGHEPAIDDQPG
ncbi:LysR substrate-binding domain-containing protein [Mangrovitalea sediminis]|uniref:LysR substrate-binding domain-containing protein n=1 Tax=Mangrovitalea sediminis TaxID=1982043 RepID=UPI000BE518B7|nr:LysR substrate-binding domain-containing protein [Mangrovitalea sediminis]